MTRYSCTLYNFLQTMLLGIWTFVLFSGFSSIRLFFPVILHYIKSECQISHQKLVSLDIQSWKTTLLISFQKNPLSKNFTNYIVHCILYFLFFIYFLYFSKLLKFWTQVKVKATPQYINIQPRKKLIHDQVHDSLAVVNLLTDFHIVSYHEILQPKYYYILPKDFIRILIPAI